MVRNRPCWLQKYPKQHLFCHWNFFAESNISYVELRGGLYVLHVSLKERVCIPLLGNIPLCGNRFCILFILSEQIGIFKLNFVTLINVSEERFWVLRFWYLKFKISVHAQIENTHYYVLSANFLTSYEFETDIGDTVW